MMNEIAHIRQVPGKPLKRWFTDAFFDLFVWFTDSGDILEFQLAYDKCGEERILTWQKDRGFAHARVDIGEGGAFRNASPVLAQAGPVEANLIDLFINASEQLEQSLVTFVRDRLSQFASEVTRQTQLMPAYRGPNGG